MKEIITLQLGNVSNHVGAHFWNLQQVAARQQEGDEDSERENGDFDAARLFRFHREGSLQPRVLITDLRLNVGRLLQDQEEGENADCEDADVEWGSGTSKLARSDVPDRNPFQLFLQDCGAESYYGGGALVRGSNPSGAQVMLPVRPPENCIEHWSDYASFTLNRDENLCLLPRWTTSDNFDTFLSSYLPEVVPREFGEVFMDKLRILAEECDSLSTIQIFSDIHDGFGSLTGKLLQEIREDYGRGINVPVWALSPGARQGNTGELAESLHRLSVPQAYANLSEHASVVIPISTSAATSSRLTHVSLNGQLRYHTSAVIAASIEAATGVLNRRDAPMGMDEWLFKATSSGRFPLCELETSLPFPADPAQSLSLDEDFSLLFGHSSEEKLEKHLASGQGGCSSMKNPALNPFAHSLSSSTSGDFAVTQADASSYMRDRQRPFTNMLSIRGPCSDKLSSLLFSKCDSPVYLITACVQRHSPLALPVTFPHFFCGVDRNGWALDQRAAFSPSSSALVPATARGCSHLTVVSAVGCDARLGVHIGKVASAWSQSVGTGRIRAQIEKTGIDRGELAEINEKLLGMARAYDQTSEL